MSTLIPTLILLFSFLLGTLSIGSEIQRPPQNTGIEISFGGINRPRSEGEDADYTLVEVKVRNASAKDYWIGCARAVDPEPIFAKNNESAYAYLLHFKDDQESEHDFLREEGKWESAVGKGMEVIRNPASKWSKIAPGEEVAFCVPIHDSLVNPTRKVRFGLFFSDEGEGRNLFMLPSSLLTILRVKKY